MKLISSKQQIKVRKTRQTRHSHLPKLSSQTILQPQAYKKIRTKDNLNNHSLYTKDEIQKVLSYHFISRTKCLSLDKRNIKNYVIRRAYTPNYQKYTLDKKQSVLHTNSFAKIKQIINEPPILQKQNIDKFLKQTKFQKIHTQNLQLSSNKSIPKKKEKKSLRCKLLLQKYNDFPFWNSYQKQISNFHYETQQLKKKSHKIQYEPFSTNVSSIQCVENLEAVVLVSIDSYKQNPIF